MTPSMVPASIQEERSGHEWLMLLNAGTLAAAPLSLPRSAARSAGLPRCSRTVDFNFPRKSLRHAPCAAAARQRRYFVSL